MRVMSDAEYEIVMGGVDEARDAYLEEKGLREDAEARADEMERLLSEVLLGLPEEERARLVEKEPSLGEMV